ncbi:MAG: YbhB/YbcL family Raf kinase inhibitor-like protein [Planctomycetota bacterium]|nr:MAG: YbhB/YbcL family Raf kinase inhibitor-like protein [Planctomycetota bacterium]
MQLTSTAFQDGETIPVAYTGVGDDRSPPLAWSGVPEGTKSFALICEDPDAPSRARPRPEGPWVHWVIYNIPPEVQALPEGLPRLPELKQPAGARQGKNDFPRDNIGYRGPLPPPGSGPHRYFFTVYALDTQLDLLPAQATKKSLLAAMQGHVIGHGQLVGIFERP